MGNKDDADACLNGSALCLQSLQQEASQPCFHAENNLHVHLKLFHIPMTEQETDDPGMELKLGGDELSVA